MRTPIDVLSEFHLLDWNVLLIGWQRGWVQQSELSKFAISCIESSIPDQDLAALASLTSAEKLAPEAINRYLARLARRDQVKEDMELDIWRLAQFVSFREQNIAWEDKVTKLEELAAEFGFPSDMNGCSRYSPGYPFTARRAVSGCLDFSRD
jgi:hypothetical protein